MLKIMGVYLFLYLSILLYLKILLNSKKACFGNQIGEKGVLLVGGLVTNKPHETNSVH